VRDYAEVRANGEIDRRVASDALDLLAVDHRGLDEMDLRLLRTILTKFGGGPVGLSTIAAAVGEEAETIEEIYEPYLVKEGYLERTPRGRVSTERAAEHLGVPFVPPPGRSAVETSGSSPGPLFERESP
jgi:Holliday junction DNA helicase RuvB